MAFQRENQRIAATDLLQEIAKGQEIVLNRCTITGHLDINRLFIEETFESIDLLIQDREEKKIITLPQSLTCNSCRFEGDVFFSAPWESLGELEIVFEKGAHFNLSVFSGQALFCHATFKDFAVFDGCRFDAVASFKNARFCGPAWLRGAAFNKYGLFAGVNFEHEAKFISSYFSKGGDFTNVRFKGKTDFSGVYSSSKSVPIYESVHFARRRHGDDETFWRFIKQAAQEAGHYQLAGESFYNERCAHLWRKFRGPGYDELSLGQKFVRLMGGVRLLPELVFGRLLFGYGERPIRVLFASALIILLCAAFFCSPWAEVTYRTDALAEQLTFPDGLYFSTITFTTLGFGDMHPARLSGLTKAVAMAEALAGACLMALFVVSLSKRYSRG